MIELDDAELGLRLRAMADTPADEGSRWAELMPGGVRAMSLTLGLERSTAGVLTLVVRFPFGGGDRRQGLLGVGWQLEPNIHGTRYYVRRFEAPPGTPLDLVVTALRQAYAVVYGPRLTFSGWMGRFSVVAVADSAAADYRRDIAPSLGPRRRGLGFLLIVGGSIAFLVAFGTGAALAELHAGGEIGYRVGIGLLLGSLPAYLILLLLGLLVLRGGRLLARLAGGPVGIAQVVLVLAAIVLLMSLGVLAAIGVGGATVHDSGPAQARFIRFGIGLIALAMILYALPGPKVDLAAGIETRYSVRLRSDSIVIRSLRVVVVLAGAYLGWRMLIG